jgi:hypothetical protein
MEDRVELVMRMIASGRWDGDPTVKALGEAWELSRAAVWAVHAEAVRTMARLRIADTIRDRILVEADGYLGELRKAEDVSVTERTKAFAAVAGNLAKLLPRQVELGGPGGAPIPVAQLPPVLAGATPEEIVHYARGPELCEVADCRFHTKGGES